MKRVLAVLSSGLAIALFGCAGTDPMTGATPARTAAATNVVNSHANNRAMSVQYGTIEDLQRVAMAPDYGDGALIGGALGLLPTVGSQGNGAATRAGLGALVAIEAAGTAEKFTVRVVNNSTIEIVTENQDLQLGDCVSVEQGSLVNIRRVSSVMCSTPPSDLAYQAMYSSTLRESSECQEAKQALLQAKTVEQTDTEYKKMRAFCES